MVPDGLGVQPQGAVGGPAGAGGGGARGAASERLPAPSQAFERG